MAGALDLQLAGPRVYGGSRVSEPMMHASGRSDAGPADILAGIGVFYAACGVMAALIAIIWAISKII